MKGLIDSTKIGTRMTEKGRKLFSEVLSLIPTGTSIASFALLHRVNSIVRFW